MKGNTEYKRRVHMIIHSIIHLEPEYVLDKKYVRWGKVEADLFELEDAILTSAIHSDGNNVDICKACHHVPCSCPDGMLV